MSLLFLGIGLMIAGGVLFGMGRRFSQRTVVKASGGSVAVGGSSTAPITNVNVNSHNQNSAHGGHALTVVAIFIEIIGIAVVIWHAWHLTGR